MTAIAELLPENRGCRHLVPSSQGATSRGSCQERSQCSAVIVVNESADGGGHRPSYPVFAPCCVQHLSECDYGVLEHIRRTRTSSATSGHQRAAGCEDNGPGV